MRLSKINIFDFALEPVIPIVNIGNIMFYQFIDEIIISVWVISQYFQNSDLICFITGVNYQALEMANIPKCILN